VALLYLLCVAIDIAASRLMKHQRCGGDNGGILNRLLAKSKYTEKKLAIVQNFLLVYNILDCFLGVDTIS
jgi:hypothetical protein